MLSKRDILHAVKVLSMVLLVCYAGHELCVFYGYEAGQAVFQILFWLLLLGLLLFSGQPVFRNLRSFLAKRIANFFLAGKVEFVDVMMADALTSMSKLLADMQVCGGDSDHFLSCWPFSHEHLFHLGRQVVVCAVAAVVSFDYTHTNSRCIHSTVAPTLASVPYAIRAVQCYYAYRDTGKSSHLVNLGKYLSSFPVIWTSALKHQLAPVEGVSLDLHDQHLQVLWLYTVTINTMYSFLWDVIMDWGLARSPTSHYPLLRSELLYRQPLFYYAAIVGDLALRLCWSLQLSSHLQQHASGE